MPQESTTGVRCETQMLKESEPETRNARRLAWLGVVFACVAPLTLVLMRSRFIGFGPFLFAVFAIAAGYRSERKGVALGALPLALGMIELFFATGLQLVTAVMFPV